MAATIQRCLNLVNKTRSALVQGIVYGHSETFAISKHLGVTSVIPSRQYGRKVRVKPPKITYFSYSGDLRTLPEIEKETILYEYRGIETEFENNEVLKKLSSIEFATGPERLNHRRELVKDRMVELFGPDSELEQTIALLTLKIRKMIPVCIKYRSDKFNKIWLLKSIFRRRRLLTHLRSIDHQRFEWLLRELKIRYVIPRDRVEYKGWKYNLREATSEEAVGKQRQKLEELKSELESRKEEFYKHKAEVLAQIEKDLQEFGMSRDFLEQLQAPEKETVKTNNYLTWDERVKLGMTDRS